MLKWDGGRLGQPTIRRLCVPRETPWRQRRECLSSALRSSGSLSAAGSTAETTAATPEVTTAASTSTELASTTARTAAATAPVSTSTSSLALVRSSTAATAAVVLDLREAVVGRRLSLGLGGIVGPALGAGDRCRCVRGLGLGGVARDDLEGLGQRLVLATGLLVPLCSRSSVSSLRLNACRRRCQRLLGLGSANGRGSSVELCQACVCNGGVRNGLGGLGLGSVGLSLRNVVDPGLLCGERSLLERGLLDLRVCRSVSYDDPNITEGATYRLCPAARPRWKARRPQHPR
jgi:hypothetical protein